MSLKLGSWKVNVNGVEGNLGFDSLDQQNVLLGQLGLGAVPAVDIQGFWDETARSILFSPISIEQAIQGPLQVPIPVQFKGFLFSTPTTPEPGQDILWTLTGYYQVSSATNLPMIIGQARRNTFGWFAQITEVA